MKPMKKMKCQDKDKHPDVVIEWAGSMRPCPLCNTHRLLERERGRRAKADNALETANQLEADAEHNNALAAARFKKINELEPRLDKLCDDALKISATNGRLTRQLAGYRRLTRSLMPGSSDDALLDAMASALVEK